MNHKQLIRVLIFDDDESIRKMLWGYFDHREYEVFTFPHPESCPLSKTHHCDCPIYETCTDIIISDIQMPFMKGIDFLEQQKAKGCKVKHFALMSGNPSDDDYNRAKKMGIKLFKKPFSLSEIDIWVQQVETEISPERSLSKWYLETG